MKRAILSFILLLLADFAFAQKPVKNPYAGMISLGMRSTYSSFSDGTFNDWETGYGGQLRVQFSEKINSDWFADYLTGSVGSLADRQDVHIGWSIMYYPLNQPGFENFLKPYIVAGHCFDWTNMEVTSSLGTETGKKFSSAVQMGLGTHFNLTDRMDLSLTTQYMIHLGKDIHIRDYPEGGSYLYYDDHLDLEGHMLFTLSCNYKIVELW